MKTIPKSLTAVLMASVAALNLAGQEIIEKGLNHRVVRSVVERAGVLVTNVYTELGTGLYHEDPQTGQLVESVELIEMFQGAAVGRGGGVPSSSPPTPSISSPATATASAVGWSV